MDAPEDRDDSSLMSPTEAALYFNVNQRTVRRWAVEGLIPCVITAGGHHRFRREDVETLIAEMRAGHPSTWTSPLPET